MPCTITMQSKAKVPDIEAWKERVRKNPGRDVQPVYTLTAQGKRTLLVCSRGPKGTGKR
jgi:G:T-mismatch repair DNA endonuclease (very short patch repair protein)